MVGIDRVFHVPDATGAADIDLELSGLTIQHGNTAGSSDNSAGGILLEGVGTLRVIDSIISDVSAGEGGAIDNDDNGTVEVTNSTIRDITSSSQGGAINNDSDGSVLTVTDSAILRINTAGQGGAINNNNNGTATLLRVTISDVTTTGQGGAINNNLNGALSLTDVAIARITCPLDASDDDYSRADQLIVASDRSWKVSDDGPDGWEQPGFDASGWRDARELGPVGIEPWGTPWDAP